MWGILCGHHCFRKTEETIENTATILCKQFFTEKTSSIRRGNLRNFFERSPSNYGALANEIRRKLCVMG